MNRPFIGHAAEKTFQHCSAPQDAHQRLHGGRRFEGLALAGIGNVGNPAQNGSSSAKWGTRRAAIQHRRAGSIQLDRTAGRAPGSAHVPRNPHWRYDSGAKAMVFEHVTLVCCRSYAGGGRGARDGAKHTSYSSAKPGWRDRL